MVRIVGLILVALGLIGFGWQGFAQVAAESGVPAFQEQRGTFWVPPVVSGIVVVSGLILLASHGRREEP